MTDFTMNCDTELQSIAGKKKEHNEYAKWAML